MSFSICTVQPGEEQMQIITSSASVLTTQLGATDGLSISITRDNGNQAKTHRAVQRDRACASELGTASLADLPRKNLWGLTTEKQPSYLTALA